MTRQQKIDLITLHKVSSTIDPGAAAQALIMTIGKALKLGAMTPQDAAIIIMTVFDEESPDD